MFSPIHHAGDAVLFFGGRIVSAGYVSGAESDIGNIAVSIPVIFTGENISWKAFSVGGSPGNWNTDNMVFCFVGNVGCNMEMW